MMAMPPERREQMLERLPPSNRCACVRRSTTSTGFRRRKKPANGHPQHVRQPAAGQAGDSHHQIQFFNHLPDDRIAVLRPELLKLHRMSESERSDRIASDEFKSRFTQPSSRC